MVTSPTATPTSTQVAASPTPLSGPSRYQVKEGDTLAAIALRFGTTVEALAHANGLKEPYLLEMGQELLIPEPAEQASATPTATPTPRPRANPPPVGDNATATPTPQPRTNPAPAPATATPVPPEENTATPTPQPRNTTTSYAIEIPAIGVYADMVPVGKAPDGTMATPENPYAVGWYAAGPRPGSQQNVLLTGHLDFVDAQRIARPGVFWRLRQLQSGDLVYLVQDSQRYRYVVQESIKVRYDDPEAIDLLAPRRGALVTMITCEGPEFDPVARNYLWRRLVVAVLWPN